MKRMIMSVVVLAVACWAALPALANELEGKRIAHITATTKNPFIATLAKTIETQAADLGMKVTTFTSPFDPALQTRQVNDAIAQKFDIIALVPISEHAIIPALTRAKKAGIPVVLVNSPIAPKNEELFVSFVGEDHKTLGRLTGQALVQALKDRKNAKVALITGSLAEGVAPRRVAGFKEVIEKHPNIEIVAIEDAKWDTARSEQIAGQLFARFSGQGGLDAIYAMADNMAHGVIQAAKSAGVELGAEDDGLVVVSSNCMKFGIDHIKAGAQYSTATQMPTRTGKAVVEIIADYFGDKDVPKEKILDMTAITKENLEKFADTCSF